MKSILIFTKIIINNSRYCCSFIFTADKISYEVITSDSVIIRYTEFFTIINSTNDNCNHRFKLLWNILTGVNHCRIRNRSLFNHFSIIVNFVSIIKDGTVCYFICNSSFLDNIHFLRTKDTCSIL